ncbi:MAG: hypothetical protein F4155_01530 [Acidimicrobiales bacterium]|nr:hypothetical protein [Acidimicrobiales bacterium]MYH73463.1 hypothetical protein [Acidimicrobiales bacterium]MYK72722.1 hypothetical protein [Acidimicrobiales bacterium]
MMASSDLDRSIKRAVYDITDELRIINGTIAAAAICSDHSEARDFLENALRDGAAVFSERAAREERQARFRATFGGTAASSSESPQTPT